MKYCALTQLKAKSAAAGSYADGQGLWLAKSSKDRGKWVLRLFLHGKRREMGLGRWPDVTIFEARQRAAEARQLVRVQADPIEARRVAKRGARRLSVKEAIEGCFTARQAELKKEGQAGRWMSPLAVHVIPKIGSQPIEALDQHVIKDVLEPIWHDKPEAALKALNRLNLALKHAAALGVSVDMQACMKARALLGKQRHTTQHIPSLPYRDAPKFYRSLQADESVAARALRFLMLTCARTTEVRLISFDEISGDIWELPGERTKTGVGRRIPLGLEALAIVDQCKETPSTHLFPAYRGQPISDAAMAALMKRRALASRPHGFRATFRTWCEEQTNADFQTKEAVLGHAVDSGVVGAYQRSDRLERRRHLMKRWEKFLLSRVSG